MTRDQWLKTGIDNGWCSEIFCAIHDGLPTTDDEDSEFELGYDPCIPGVRIWDQPNQRKETKPC